MKLALSLLLFSILSGLGAPVTLAWNHTSDPNLAGYKLFIGDASRTYARSNVVARTDNQSTFPDLLAGRTYYFAVKAFVDTGEHSDYSTEVVYTVPVQVPQNLQVVIILQSASTVNGPWTTNAVLVQTVPMPANTEQLFFRSLLALPTPQ